MIQKLRKPNYVFLTFTVENALGFCLTTLSQSILENALSYVWSSYGEPYGKDASFGYVSNLDDSGLEPSFSLAFEETLFGGLKPYDLYFYFLRAYGGYENQLRVKLQKVTPENWSSYVQRVSSEPLHRIQKRKPSYDMQNLTQCAYMFHLMPQPESLFWWNEFKPTLMISAYTLFIIMVMVLINLSMFAPYKQLWSDVYMTFTGLGLFMAHG